MATKLYYRCIECERKTSTTDRKRAEAKLCVTCRPALDAPKPEERDVSQEPAEAVEPEAPAPEAVPQSEEPTTETPPPETDDAQRFTVTTDAGDEVSVTAEKRFGRLHLEFHGPALGETGYFSDFNAPVDGFREYAQRKASALQTEYQAKTNRGAKDSGLGPEKKRQYDLLGKELEKTDANIKALEENLRSAKSERAAIQQCRRNLMPTRRYERRDPNEPRRPSLLDAAAAVLKDIGADMQVKPLWDEIRKRKLWDSPKEGKTPEATLASAMQRELKEKGAASRFVKTGRGLFAYNGDLPEADA